MPRSLLNLPRWFRPLFFFGYLAVQVTLLVRAQHSPDFVFGFQMFNASSELEIRLFRRLRTRGHVRVSALPGGAWTVTDSAGQPHTYHWQDRVRDGVLGNLDRFVHASYGLDGQLFRLQYALQDVASHLPDDPETEALIAVVDTVNNGRERGRVRLQAERR